MELQTEMEAYQRTLAAFPAPSVLRPCRLTIPGRLRNTKELTKPLAAQLLAI